MNIGMKFCRLNYIVIKHILTIYILAISNLEQFCICMESTQCTQKGVIYLVSKNEW